MKLLPGLFSNNFDDFFRDPFFSTHTKSYMKTDITESDTSYLLDVELPGYKKEDIQLELSNGYLIISANKNNTKEEKDKDGNIIRQERFSGSCSRSFYVGEQVTQEQIKANFDNGELKVNVPKTTETIPEKKYISIA